ncbi:hypothetical protein LTR56_027069 [Elasticomyces elasticus]|nr:hypothetical protein LTR56_027069 [Elasticomyces elasticus]KAK4904894.1 hypothetical protein LTR49_025744 [Elasticomyces elasticus]KAK5731667.1 hypothetical protein LTS12_027230 [Elasticomyces elasticus]
MYNITIYVVSAVCLGLLYITAVAVYNRFFHPLSNIPGPLLASWTRLWLVYRTIQRRSHLSDLSLHARYGPCVRIAPNELLISNIHYFKTIYGTDTKFSKSTWYDSIGSDESDFNLLAESNLSKYWQQKRLISPVFTTQALRQHQALLARALNTFITKFKNKANEPQDLVRWMNILALDVLTEMTWSCSPNYVLAEDDNGNCADIDRFWQHLSWIGLLPTFNRCYKRVQKLLENVGLTFLYKPDTGRLSIIQFYISQIVARSKESPELASGHRDIAGTMHNHRAMKPELKKEWADIMLLHVVGAGFDTLGATLASCISLISQTPGCQSRLVQEISDAGIDEDLEHENLKGLMYLQACIRESIRLKPVVATSMSRTIPMQGMWVEGNAIPGGTIIGMNPVVLHRSRELFGDDAGCFRPERWLEASKEQHDAMEYYDLSFGSPARSCPGKNLALMILCRTVADVFRHFSVRIIRDSEVSRLGLPAFKEASFFVYKPYNIWAEFTTREKLST